MNQQPPSQPPQGQGQQQPVQLLRPENMRTIQYLSVQERQRYEEGLQTLWLKIEQNPPESQEHQQAKQKVADFSRMVMNKIKNINARNNGNAPNPSGGGGPQQPPNQGAQAQVQIQIPAGAAQQPTMSLNRPQASPVNKIPTNPANMTANGPQAGGPTTNQTTIPRHIMEHINKLPWSSLSIPPHVTPEQVPKWLADTKAKYMRALMQMELTRTRIGKVDAIIKERQEKGVPTTQDEIKRFQNQRATDKKAHADAETFVKNLRGQLSTNQAPSQVNGAQMQVPVQPGRAQPMQQGNSNGVTSTHSMQVPTASINAAMDAAKTTQMAAANRATSAGGVQQPSQPPTQPTPSNQPQVQTPVTPATPSANAPSQTLHPAPAPAQIKTEPAANTQHLQSVNTARASASGMAPHIQSAGTPTQAPARVQTPQSAQQANGANVRPLSHAAAVNRANSSSTITGQPGNSSNGMANNTPNLTGMAAQPGHPHAHPQAAAPTLTSKMPIPKTLHDKATAPPQPVAVGGGNTPGRPTYGGGNGAGGVMNQPIIAKMPVPQFDTEGDHVLSKKKLDELVRQVCGGGSPGADGNYLTPDVEESVLNVADNFVDNVLHMACQLAKERGSKVLEIRDIQLILERVYNMRIPGYTSDELRTVRKVQPSPNWIAKMSAIQAAKVTSGKDDK
jgi:transcription initiation factor TFIID subunit 12